MTLLAERPKICQIAVAWIVIEVRHGQHDHSVRGTHRSISRKHMQKYLVEFEFRFNLRGSVSSSMFDRLIQAF
jgi:inner membrane protein involved in colicin E2 resistance